MSAIVEGMSMVRHCGECELNKLNWDRCHQILRGCPIIGEIPTPHGRLIDADRLMKVIEKNSYLLKGYYNSLENGMFLTGIKQAINEAPTIIDAEVSE